MKTKVIIIQEYNTPYRNELFNLVAGFDDIDLTLLYIGQRGENRQWQDQLETRFREVQVRCSIRQLNYEQTSTALSYLDLIKKVLAINPDVVISQLSKITILLHYILFWKKVPLIHWSESTVVTENGVNWFSKSYLKWHLHLSKAFLVPGRMAEEYLAYCGFKLAGRVFLAPNSVDSIYAITEKELADKYECTSPVKFLFIGSFVERKGFHHLKEVFSRLQDENFAVELHVAGAGPISPSLNMINHGFVTKYETLALYKNTHVFVIPSLYDCNPLSLIEAAKTGNILIASKGVGNYPELIDGNGFVTEIDNADSLYEQCINILTKSRDELIDMAKISVEKAKYISHANTAAAFRQAILFVTGQS